MRLLVLALLPFVCACPRFPPRPPGFSLSRDSREGELGTVQRVRLGPEDNQYIAGFRYRLAQPGMLRVAMIEAAPAAREVRLRLYAEGDMTPLADAVGHFELPIQSSGEYYLAVMEAWMGAVRMQVDLTVTFEPGPVEMDLSKVKVRVAPETQVNDPALRNRALELRMALVTALDREGFKLEGNARLVATTSIDYTPRTALSPASLYVAVTLKHEGESVDQAEVHKVNESFPDPADLARTLAHTLATSPRLRAYVTSHNY